MKQETNNEIDLLLRRLGRRPGTVSDPDGDHLDADELSSYAENALPEAARARYTEHLSECSNCRKMVVQLSSAAGVVVAPERVVAAAPSGLRKFLASLFTPMVLRYAVPALGLAVIAMIGLTVFRKDPPVETDLAQRSSAPAAANEQVQTPSPESLQYAKSDGSAPAATPDTSRINALKEPTPAPTPVDKISAPTVAADSAANAAPPPKSEPQPVANTPAPSPATTVATEITERKVQQLETQKKEVEGQIESAKAPQRDRAYQASDEGRRTGTGAAPAAAAGTEKKKEDFSSARPQGGGLILQQAEKDSSDAEIRTVAGRRFRKRGRVWVDTAYESSSETMNLTRGSERYRALIADEPGLKNIAEQLDGEIIVVWKGRAYRIR